MGIKLDLTGKRFTRLTVIKVSGKDAAHKTLWLCACDCGNESIVAAGNLTSGTSKSCGCLKSDRIKETKTIHGRGTKDPTYGTWYSMRQRCRNPNNHKYKYYGGRGITVCKRWDAFLDFLADMGERPAGRTLDRIDPDGNYEPGNCRWATPREQRLNQRKQLKQLTHKEAA